MEELSTNSIGLADFGIRGVLSQDDLNGKNKSNQPTVTHSAQGVDHRAPITDLIVKADPKIKSKSSIKVYHSLKTILSRRSKRAGLELKHLCKLIVRSWVLIMKYKASIQLDVIQSSIQTLVQLYGGPTLKLFIKNNIGWLVQSIGLGVQILALT